MFLEFILRVREALAKVYASSAPASQKLVEKSKTIDEFKKIYAADYVPRFQTKQYRDFTDPPLNNAYIMLFGLYTNDIPLLAAYNKEVCNGDLRKFMVDMKKLSKQPGDMVPKIRSVLGGKNE